MKRDQQTPYTPYYFLLPYSPLSLCPCITHTHTHAHSLWDVSLLYYYCRRVNVLLNSLGGVFKLKEGKKMERSVMWCGFSSTNDCFCFFHHLLSVFKAFLFLLHYLFLSLCLLETVFHHLLYCQIFSES